MKYKFHIVDVFSASAFGGNQLAVLPEASGISPEGMQKMMEALRPLARHMVVENVAPLVVYLASRRCAESGRVFSVGAGHIARVFIGATRGWCAPGLTDMTPEQVEANLAASCDLGEFSIPESLYDECRYIAEHLPKSG